MRTADQSEITQHDPRDPSDVLPIGIRAWTRGHADPEGTQQTGTGNDQLGRPQRRYPPEVLVFDTETRDEPGQGLMFGVWRLYRDNLDDTPASLLIEEGIFYPDDLPREDPNAWTTLRDYVKTHAVDDVSPGFSTRLAFMPVSVWLKDRLHTYGYKHRDNCDVVGFNLPFDLGALARHYGRAEPSRNGRGLSYYGGWSLSFAGRNGEDGKWRDTRYRPRLRMRSIDPRRTLIAWASLKEVDDEGKKPQPVRNMGNGRFVDLRTLAFALTDRSLTLESACETFGHPYRKREIEYGVITPDALDYGREDVAATADLYRACLAELSAHTGVELSPHRLYSPATVGARYLDAMAVPQPLQRFSLSDEYLGACMSAFYGGRAEARIVRTPVPVVLVDFTSMYPAQNALLDTWKVLTATQVAHQDVTDHVRAMIADPDLFARLHDKTTWAEDIGVTFVEITHIDGAILPVRARYEPPGLDEHPSDGAGQEAQEPLRLDGSISGNLGIGLNPLHYNGTMVYALPDILAATILGPPAFQIVKATRLLPQRGQVAGLRQVPLRGGELLDPAGRDPFLSMIELRHRVKRDDTLDASERERLDLFLKITANATSYGSLARFDRNDTPKPVPVTAYGPGGAHASIKTRSPEKPGQYCFPPVAASITAGARLTLAMMETHLTRRGGSYAFMDTDSTAIIATPDGGPLHCPGEPDDTLHSLSHADVYDILHAFTDLNPYGLDVENPDPQIPRSPWKIEKDSRSEPLNAYVISAKRYLLYRDDADKVPSLVHIGSDRAEDPDDCPNEDLDSFGDADNGGTDYLDLVDWSEHGIGLYQDPLGLRDNHGRRIWIRQAWDAILSLALAGTRDAEDADDQQGWASELPTWADRPALTQFTLNTPRQLGWFGQALTGEPSPAQPRPGAFGLIGQIAPLTVRPGPTPIPVACYTSHADQWRELHWRDRSTGQPLTINTADPDDEPEIYAHRVAAGNIELRTLSHVLHHYQLRPEHKSLAPDATPAGSATVGKMKRRPVHAEPGRTMLIGKESNKLAERLAGTDTGQFAGVLVYGTVGDDWEERVRPALTEIGAKQLARHAGVSEHAARAWIKGTTKPHAGKTEHMQTVLRLVSEHLGRKLGQL